MNEHPTEYITDALEMIGITEPKQIVTEISGFVPVFEVVLHHYKDYVTALVFGRMWQYCGMSDGVCRASLDKIASDLEMSAATVMRHAEKLTADGFLIDTTPERRNAPHEYVDGRRVEMKNRYSAGIAQRNATVSQRNATVSQSQLIKQDNTKIKQLPAGAVFKKYQDNIAMLTPTMSDKLQEAENTYPAEWIVEAIDIAVVNNKRNWGYCEAILKRWKSDGKDAGKKTDIPQRKEGVSSGYFA